MTGRTILRNANVLTGERRIRDATVVLKGDATITPKDLKAYLADRVPRWQLPERWSIIEEVPKTSVGKFAKTRIREAYAAGDYEVVEVP